MATSDISSDWRRRRAVVRGLRHEVGDGLSRRCWRVRDVRPYIRHSVCDGHPVVAEIDEVGVRFLTRDVDASR